MGVGGCSCSGDDDDDVVVVDVGDIIPPPGVEPGVVGWLNSSTKSLIAKSIKVWCCLVMRSAVLG